MPRFRKGLGLTAFRYRIVGHELFGRLGIPHLTSFFEVVVHLTRGHDHDVLAIYLKLKGDLKSALTPLRVMIFEGFMKSGSEEWGEMAMRVLSVHLLVIGVFPFENPLPWTVCSRRWRQDFRASILWDQGFQHMYRKPLEAHCLL